MRACECKFTLLVDGKVKMRLPDQAAGMAALRHLDPSNFDVAELVGQSHKKDRRRPASRIRRLGGARA